MIKAAGWGFKSGVLLRDFKVPLRESGYLFHMSALEWTADRFRLYPASGPVSAGIQFHPSAIFHATRGVCFLLYTHWFYNIMLTYYPTWHNGKF